MALIGSNGGLIGSRRSAAVGAASGLWTANEQVVLKRAELWTTVSDSNAATYIAAVEAADGQPLENAVKTAINTFVVGCKADGIWTAIKASCILAGARTLSGALVPLVGTAPTNNNFVGGDYNRETGLVGDGSTKYLDSGRAGNADLQNNGHLSVYVSTASPTVPRCYAACQTSSVSFEGQNGIFNATASTTPFRSRLSAFDANHEGARSTSTATGLIAWSRSASNSFTARDTQSNQTISATSSTSTTRSYYVFARNIEGAANAYADSRIAFYSIGESLDLALLDTRVTTLVNDIAAAIP